ncbi:metallophosphoesterase family protein [Alicyclobacillus sp. ALC3]|uniref:metallophosphoesterase family protein n=1 Tax=Alicyclobacillus sp. ALC3 TaxID=2796143 RepID=UPI00237983B6|nr:metallophosphoesterase [Alicyclobacillus sp. ALC3]WDL96895.1 metallophosphoesterase [Alicyclobacillus sp. ALC3]
MRICVVSDTHRFRHELMQAVSLAGPINAVLHAGDETSDAAWLADRIHCPVHAVAGNWDTRSTVYPDSLVVTGYGPPLFLTHGHRLQVKNTLLPLAKTAHSHGASIAVFGHTHIALAEEVDSVLCINPGSLSQPRGRKERTFAILTIRTEADAFEVSVTHLTSSGKVLPDTTRSVSIPRFE